MSHPQSQTTQVPSSPQGIHSGASNHKAANRIPRATYRFQLRSRFGFQEILDLIDYVEQLGISDLYLSPLFQSREESEHGYDVVDHSRIEPTFGDEEKFRELAISARDRNLGILLDLVPNHMGINDPNNLLWNDVLENGPGARSASCFDIVWNPAGSGVSNQILLPFLGRPFGEILEEGELSLQYVNDRFLLSYYDRKFPIAPPTWSSLLNHAITLLSDDCMSDDKMELQSIVTQLQRLPSLAPNRTETIDERYREQEIARRRLTALTNRSSLVSDAIAQTLAWINGGNDGPQRWSELEELLSRQHYRLAFWRVAADEINYRRFFDINDLAAIRVENENVFNAVHELTFRLIAEGLVTGVRIDHPDGLLDPKDYFRRLQSTFARCLNANNSIDRPTSNDHPPLYIVAEKILSGDEKLRGDWPVNGTTGYDFLNELSGLMVHSDGVGRLQDLYEEMTDINERPRDIIYHGKLTILQDSMSSELAMITSQLFELTKASRATRDYTLPALHRALREIIACFPVYRSYVPSVGWEVTDEDHRRVMEAVRWAKRRNRTMTWSMLDYIASVLLLEFPANLSDDLKPQWRKFATRFQQVTGPVTAKGVEDTAFYRFFPLASLNEVGGELGNHGVSAEQFNLKMQARWSDWPHALSTTATHDTKRGEDVRSRLHVLSEAPESWVESVAQLHDATKPFLQELDGELVPSKNERYLIYQTLLGTWPISSVTKGSIDLQAWEKFRDRISAYCIKALREAKQHTSWLNPSATYEKAISSFLNQWMDSPSSAPMHMLDSLASTLAGPGYVNSISQVVLKSTLPGVPDFYQGCEFWDFRLVDPDNRQPVDFDTRTKTLANLQSAHKTEPLTLLRGLHEHWTDELKMFVTWRSLEARRSFPDVFEQGTYHPITFEGPRSAHLFGFLRRLEAQWICVIVPLFPRTLLQHREWPMPQVTRPQEYCDGVWDSTRAIFPPETPTVWVDHISGNQHGVTGRYLEIQHLFKHQFVAVLSGNTIEGTTL